MTIHWTWPTGAWLVIVSSPYITDVRFDGKRTSATVPAVVYLSTSTTGPTSRGGQP